MTIDATSLARAYFEALYPPALAAVVPPAYLSVVNQEPGVQSGAMPARHVLVSDPGALAAEAVRLSDDVGTNVWVSVCAHAEDLGVWHRGKRSEVTLLPALWIDVDIAGPGHAAGNLPLDVDQVVRGLLQPFGLDPTMIVHSGGGLHVYWCLDALAQVTDANRGELQGLLRAWTARFQALAAERGWHLDNVSDLARVLRPAGTLNRKPGRADPPLVSILLAGGPRYSLEALRAHVGPFSALPIVGRSTETPTIGSALSFDDTLAEVRGKIARNARPERRDVLRAVSAGEPFAQPGDRDRALYQVCSWLAFYCPDGDPEAILEILTPSLEAMEAESPDDFITSDLALQKIERCLDDARAKAAQEKTTNNRLASALRAAGRDSSRTAGPAPAVVPRGSEAGAEDRVVPPDPPAPLLAGGAAGSYTSGPDESPLGLPGKRDAAYGSHPRTNEVLSQDGGGQSVGTDHATETQRFLAAQRLLPGLAPEVLRVLEEAGRDLNAKAIGGALERPGAKVEQALEFLAAEGLIFLIHPRGGAKTWTASKPEPPPAPDADGEMIGDVSAYRTRWTNRDDLVAHGEEQLRLSGVPPDVADWESDRETFVAAMALNHTIITTPAGDKFLALPNVDKPGRHYVMYAKGELEECFWRDIKIVREIWKRDFINSEGEKKEKTFRRVLSELSVPAQKWLYDGLCESSYLDDDGVFHYKCWHLEPVAAEFNEDCDAYLRSWGEDNYVRLCDWFAHLTRLAMPSTMLVLLGDPGAGKDLLIAGAASQFRKWGGAVTGHIAVDNFNADLNDCPVVGCSEKLPSDWKGTAMEAASLKERITAKNHDFNDKNVKRVKLLGHLRWVLSTNNPDFFPTREALSQASQDAVLERLTVIESPHDGGGLTPKKFLAERGGFAFTSDWIDGEGTLVRHLRHVMLNHKIVRSHTRFGIQPYSGNYKLILAVNTPVSKQVVTGLVMYLVGEVSKRGLSKSVRVGDGRVLVQIGELHRQWATLTSLGEGAGGTSKVDVHKLPPSAQVLAEEVTERLAARDDVEIDGRQYKAIRVELLVAHARAIGREREVAEALALSEAEFAVRVAAIKVPGVFGQK